MSPLTSCFQHHTRRLANPMRKGNKKHTHLEERNKTLDDITVHAEGKKKKKNPGTNKQYSKVAGYKIQLFP